MICPKCGRRTYKNENICPKCGTDMTMRHASSVGTARVQVKRSTPVYTPEPEPIYTPEPIQTQPEEVYTSYVPEPEPVHYSVPDTPTATTQAPSLQRTPAASYNAPVQEKEDLDRTLTFAAIKESSSIETAAVREYNRMKAQLRESKASDDASKVVLERLPEGFVYVKMSIDDADRMSKRKNIPKPLVIAVAGAAVVTVLLIVLLLIVTGTGGKAAPAITGKWQGEIEPLRFGITGIPFTTVDTVWEFEKNGDVKITPQDSMLAGYDLIGTYELKDKDGKKAVHLDLDYYGEAIQIDIIYSIDADTMTISSYEQPSHTYTFEKLN